MPKLLIVGGRVIDPVSNTDKPLDIAIDNGIVVALSKKLPTSPLGKSDRLINADGCLITPGLIDPHVHLREPGGERAETIESGTAAAVSGGFTSVVCMPNTTPSLDSDIMMRYVLHRAEQTGHCRVFPVGAVTKARHGSELAEIELMARAGAAGFSDDGDCIASAAIMSKALATIKPTGLSMMQHCQEATLTKGGVMHAGEVATRMGLAGWPRAAEELIIDRDVRLNVPIGCPYHVQHISSGASVNIIHAAQKEGLPVTAEATPHHLLLTCDLIETLNGGYDTLLKMNPPLRERKDIDALKKAIASNIITVLGTDHAPHPTESKQVPFDVAAFGIVGLETALALYIEALIEDGVIKWPKLIEMMTINPAKLCALDHRGLGMLKVGGPADITIIDPKLPWTITPGDFAGKSTNSPFIGRKVNGRSVMTIVQGKIAHERTR